jgi:IS605 OrfB family transposase
MQRTVSIKLVVSAEQGEMLLALREEYRSACNKIIPHVVENRCWNRVALHNLCYTKMRETSKLGSQMVCNAIYSVCKAYKNRCIAKKDAVPTILFRKYRSVHFDKRTYSIKNNTLSLYTLQGRLRVEMSMGEFQQRYFGNGKPKEAELIFRNGYWYFNLVLDLPNRPISESTALLGVDLGENVLAAISSGKLFGGEKVRHERYKFLSKRRKLQSNGSQSAKQLLRKISGKEARRMKHTNHNVSKQIIQEAIKTKAGAIVLENLTNIRRRIRAGKKMRTRLHSWAFHQLQSLIQYKAENQGLQVIYVNPAYSSQTCSQCDRLGDRNRHLFQCSCGNRQHSDLNASRTLCRFALSIGRTTCAVNRTQVAAL